MKWLCIILTSIWMLHGYGKEDNVTTSPQIVYGTIGADNLHAEFKKHFNIQEGQRQLIGYLEFKKQYFINESTYLYVKYALEYFKSSKVAFVIVHLDSLGGELMSTIKIVDLFQKFDVNEGIPLIAHIDRYAVASGAMLAYACRFIAVSDQAVMGGSLNAHPNPQKVWEVPSSYLPYMLNEYASLANLYGRDPVIAEAMVDPSIIIVERNNQLVRLYSPEDVSVVGESPDVVLTTNTDLLTLNAQQLITYGIADFEITENGGFFPDKEEKKEGRWLFSKSFLSKEPYLSALADAEVVIYHHWVIAVLLFLTYPPIGALLIIGAIVSFYLQIKSKRWKLFGLIGIAFLALLILSSIALQALVAVDVIFLALGLTLIVIDSARKTLTGGVIGFLGVGFISVSIIMLMLPGFEKFSLLDFESSAFIARSLLQRILWIVGALIVASGTIFVLKRWFFHHDLPVKEPTTMQEVFKEYQALKTFEESTLPKEGSEGITHSSLRPLGKVMVRDKIYDAVSEDGSVILKKSRVIVVRHELGRLVVKQMFHGN